MSPRKAAALRGGDQSLHEHLIAAAQRLLEHHHNLANITVRAIAREARVASGVLYNYFADKDELLVAALIARIRDTAGSGWPEGRDPTSLAGTGTLEGNLTQLMTSTIDTSLQVMPIVFGLLSNPELFHRLVGALPDDTFPKGLYRPLAEYLRAEQRGGRVAPEVDPEAAAHLVLGAVHDLVFNRMITMIHSETQPGGPAPSAQPVDAASLVSPDEIPALVTTLLHGLAPART